MRCLRRAVVMGGGRSVVGSFWVLVKTSTKSGGVGNRVLPYPVQASSCTRSWGLWTIGSTNVRTTVTTVIVISEAHIRGPV